MRRRPHVHYELRADSVIVTEGDEIVAAIPLADIVRWINYDDPWISWVGLECNNGDQMQLHDPQLHLESLLREAIPEKMIYASEAT